MLKALKFYLLMLIVSSTANATETSKVEITTNYGSMTIELYDKKFPITVENFKKYIKSDFYTDTLFYRVVENFVIQGGNVGFDYKEKKDLYPAIKNEACNDPSIRNERGTIAMARYNDLDSATSAFYINLKHNSHLDCDKYKYTVFGRIIKGLDTMEKIGIQPVRTHGDFTHLPVQDIVIKKINLKF